MTGIDVQTLNYSKGALYPTFESLQSMNMQNLSIDQQEYYRMVLWQLSLVLNMIGFYRTADNIDHPSIEAKIREWYEHLQKNLRQGKSIEIEEKDDNLYVNSLKFVPKAIVLHKLLTNLLERKIGKISLTPGLDYEETKNFLKFITLDEVKTDDISAASDAFNRLKLEHIRIEYAEYRKVGEKQKVSLKQESQAKGQGQAPAQATIDHMIDFLRSYQGKSKKIPNTWIKSIIQDPQKIAQLILLIADNENSKQELGIRGEWHEVVTTFLWAVSDYLLEQVEKGKSSKQTVKYLETLQQVIEEKVRDKKLEPDKVQHLKNNFAHMQKAVTLDGLWADWVKEGKKLDKLADQIVKELENIDKNSEAYTAFVEKIRSAKRPGEKLIEYLRNHAN